MAVETLYFSLGDEHSAQEWATIVCTLAQASRSGERTVEQIYLDTFDWAVCRQGVSLAFEQSDPSGLRLLNDGKSGKLPTFVSMENQPVWASDVPAGKMQKFLAKQMDVRALLPLAEVKSEQILLSVLDKKDRERVRLTVEVNFLRPGPRRRMAELGCRLRMDCLAGYEKDFAKTLPRFDGLTRTSQADFFADLMQRVRKTPLDYSGKLKIKLERDMRADAAAKLILLDQLDQIDVNLDGTLKNIDSEFLHDLRVAVRRSRSALNRLKGVLPPTIQEKYGAELAWVGSVTTPVRDLDVYLLDFPKYRAQLREDLQDDLQALYDFLFAQYDKAREQLIADLTSKRYKDFTSKWRTYLKRPVAARPSAPAAEMSIGNLADMRIWKTYKKVITEGSVIDDNSPAEALHDLRKTCKKLRYVLEFFASLYPAKDVGALVKALKGLQENLGDFQDTDVQADTLHDYSNQMLESGIQDPKVFLAMGVLVEQFMARKAEVRQEFAERFASFASKEVEQAFRTLTGKEKRKKVVAAVQEA